MTIRIAAVLALAFSVMGCEMYDSMIGGLAHARNVEHALQTSTGMKPTVGFKWSNGLLREVTVTFPRVFEDKPLRDVAEMVRGAVAAEFKQTPEELVVAFTVGTGNGRTAQARD